ncbi:GTPase IMAP family member 4-like [Dysidea avara]|uniref:GTPase IMAP family member 4-like n=1 Tax=Dysidea avara TaxID=196820 RepID=UPI003321BF61
MDSGAEVAVMLTGVTGAGKSSACNFLFGDEVFEVGLGMVSVTSKSNAHETVVNGKKVKLIDTPGFCDDFEKDEERVNELGKAILLAKAGVHAIALVINASHRFTAAEAKALEEIELLGELWNFMFVIFTAAKCYGKSEQKQREVVISTLDNPKCPEHLKTVMERVNRRFMMLESSDDSTEYQNSKVIEFFTMVDSIYSTNKRLYTNKLFVKANELYQEAKLKEQNREEELRKAQEGVQKMTAEMTATMATMRSEQERQQAIFEQALSSLTSQLNEAQKTNQNLANQIANMPRGGCNIL